MNQPDPKPTAEQVHIESLTPDRLALDKLIDAKVREARLAEIETALYQWETLPDVRQYGSWLRAECAELRAVPVALLVTANYLGIQYDDEGNPHFVKNPPVPAAPEANQVISTAGAAFIHANPELPTPEAVCPRCGGTGHLQMHNPKPTDTDDCPSCHGTGKRTPEGKL